MVVTFSIHSCVLMPNFDNVDKRVRMGFELANTILASYWLILTMSAWVNICRTKGFCRIFSLEMLINRLTPAMIIFCQVLSYMSDPDEGPNRWYWELLSWTAFMLWVMVFSMLRSVESLSASIRMVYASFSTMTPYIVIVVIGVLCFTNVFQSVR